VFFGSLRCFLEKTACKAQSKKSQTFVILSELCERPSGLQGASRNKKIHTKFRIQ